MGEGDRLKILGADIKEDTQNNVIGDVDADPLYGKSLRPAEARVSAVANEPCWLRGPL